MKTDTARGKLLAAGTRLFVAKGFGGTRVDEVCRAAGVSKGSFYHFFESKEDLALAVLDDFYERSREGLGGGSYVHQKDPVKRALGFVDFTIEMSKQFWGSGCLLGSLVTDVVEAHPRLQAKVSELFTSATENIARNFATFDGRGRRGEKGGKGRKGPTSTELAEQFLSIVEGSIVLAKAHGDWRRIPQGLMGFRRYLEHLAG